jgi:endoglucanase
MTPARRQVAQRLGALALLPAFPGTAAAATTPAGCAAWPAWEAFRRQFIGDGGRVEERGRDGRTVSEAQGYAMFFALVANDRPVFERLLRWTEDNLAGGDLTQRLPAWHWGRRGDGRWGVIDANAASDADLWICYALGEAGRLWRERRYTALSALLAARVLREEVADLPGLGPTLLPGPQGFDDGAGRWKLNPSYLPPLQMRWMAQRHGGAWGQVLQSSLRVLRESAPAGLAPDWVGYDGASRSFRIDETVGSYDAIRVYLWLGLTAPQDPARASLLTHFAPMAAVVERSGVPPEHIDVRSGQVDGDGPAGFSAALLPFLQALGRPAALARQLQRLRAEPPAPDAYYGQSLALFGLGAHEGRYRFDADGSLLPAWWACSAPAA